MIYDFFHNRQPKNKYTLFYQINIFGIVSKLTDEIKIWLGKLWSFCCPCCTGNFLMSVTPKFLYTNLIEVVLVVLKSEVASKNILAIQLTHLEIQVLLISTCQILLHRLNLDKCFGECICNLCEEMPTLLSSIFWFQVRHESEKIHLLILLLLNPYSKYLVSDGSFFKLFYLRQTKSIFYINERVVYFDHWS